MPTVKPWNVVLDPQRADLKHTRLFYFLPCSCLHLEQPPAFTPTVPAH